MRDLFHTTNPYEGFPVDDYELDLNGFLGADAPLREIISLVKPRTVCEVGVWKGASSFVITEEALKYRDDFQLLAVDTWTGAAEFWVDKDDELRYKELRLEHGYPTIYRQFIANVIKKQLDEYITPLPVASLNAAQLARHLKLKFDLVHIDAAHEYDSVCVDIEAWRHYTPVLIGHDYDAEGVAQAVHEKFDNVRTFDVWWFALTRDYKDGT